MKQAELLKHATCDHCQRGIGASGLPLFWRVKIERLGVDLKAVQRQDGLSRFLGHGGLAAIMGPDEDMASPVMEPKTVTLCERCAVDTPVLIAALAMP